MFRTYLLRPRMCYMSLSKNKTSLIGVAALLMVSNSVFAEQNDPGRRQFAYVANENSDSIAGYKLDASTGALSPSHGFSFGNEPTGPSWVAVDPAGRFLYATEPFGGVNAIAGFQIDRPGGRLTPIPGMPFGDHNPPVAMAIDPTGRFAYAVNQGSNNVSAYIIRPKTGRLASIPGSPFVAGNSPSAVAVDPSGRFVYVTNEVSATISSYSIDSQTGALTAIAGTPPATGLSPVSIAIDPNDKLVYVAGIGSGNVSGYSIDQTTGALTALSTSPFAAGAGGLNGITFDPSGKYVYVAGFGGIFSFAINLTPDAFAVTGGLPSQSYGQLTLIAGSPFGGGDPASIVVDYTGAFAY